MDDDVIVPLLQSQSNVLTQVAMLAGDTKTVLTKVVENQEAQRKIQECQIATNTEFLNRTFNTLVVIIVVLVLIISALLVNMNVTGGETIGEAVKKVAPLVGR